MRYLVIGTLAVTACSTEPTPTPAAAPATTPTASSTFEAVPLPPSRRLPQKEGQACAGIADLRCEDGLHCVMNGTIQPDETGVCMK